MNGTAALPVRVHLLGLLAFLATVTMLFAAFTAAYLIRRTADDWSPVALPWLVWPNTGLLLLSSAALERARRAMAGRWLTAAFLLGVLFAAGQWLAWRNLSAAGIGLATTPHGSFFYVLSAVHGAHLLGGLVALLSAMLFARPPLRACAVYWHFMAGIWVYLLVLLHLA